MARYTTFALYLVKHRMIDEFDSRSEAVINDVKEIIETGNYLEIFGFLEFVIRHASCPYSLADNIGFVLARARAAYRIIDFSVMPFSPEKRPEPLSLHSRT